ncbi:MAG TPA: alpha/beta hydrolase [Chitinophagaceae bacterium]|nr:alpha/beta hydrolase [Chitinophagaceae bacterium]
MKPHLPLFSILLIIIMGCQQEAGEGDTIVSTPAQTFLNVGYGTDALQKVDIYLPAGRSSSSTKVIILIHGGAWASGDKTDFDSYVDTLKKRQPGYAIFNINYRLAGAGSNIFPSQENDVKAAFDFIVSKSAEYRISQKFVLLGASAGGHLALLQGYKQSTPVKVKAIIDFFGPTDLVDMHDHGSPTLIPILESLLGGSPTSNPAMYQQSSPINFVTAQSPPTLILQGGVDPLVPPSQSATLNTKLQTMGVTHQYILYPGEGHGWVGDNLVNSFNSIQAFLTANVN